MIFKLNQKLFFKPIVLLLVLFLFSLKSYSQVPDTIIYDRYSTGEIEVEYPIIGKEINGDVIFYKKNGTISEKFEFKDNIPTGIAYSYNSKGDLSEMYSFDYNNEQKEGLAIEYHSSGLIKSKGYYTKGEKNGLWVEYLNTLDSYSQFEYQNDVKHGDYKYVYMGVDVTIGNFLYNCPSDTQYYYNQDGTLVSTEYWNNCTLKANDKKIFVEDYKPNYTTELVDGIKYVWFNARRFQVDKM